MTMTARQARQGDETHSAEIIDFPSTTSTASGFPPSVASEILASSTFDERLRQTVEEAILGVFFRHQLGSPARKTDPFDAIYISELKMDPIAHDDVPAIQRYGEIHDLSDELLFDDGWDD